MKTNVHLTVAHTAHDCEFQLILSAVDDTSDGLMDGGIAPQWTLKGITARDANRIAIALTKTLKAAGATIELHKINTD